MARRLFGGKITTGNQFRKARGTLKDSWQLLGAEQTFTVLSWLYLVERRKKKVKTRAVNFF
jgi:hypothetical protein